MPQPEVRVPILHRQEVAVVAAVPALTVAEVAEAVAVQAVVAVADVPADADKNVSI